MIERFDDGYYWARHEGPTHQNTTFVVLREDGMWFVPGVEGPVGDEFRSSQIICKVVRPDH